ncbi:Gfo/Idh/MocA family protein [Adhaeribacter pallidiroseus]|uniref:Biliverdin reductase n=1 Tax=Adhaeribacter pallidiroseus TaxID=2072847 RepID=A0A369QJ96_9BACT|nr:Gfo/Idh/MocA family oxidoreductase [Adhaeribacter pallidiroseus]RDC63685.1 Biliverdin reductase [Adhaeribacter pallidiroseus]
MQPDSIRDKSLKPDEPVTNQLPKLGFLGVGWIGRNRLEAIAKHQAGEVVYLSDPAANNVADALKMATQAQTAASLPEMLASGVDGIVIATPSALHAEQAIAALNAGKAVFCQKPLGRNQTETKAVVEAARSADKLLGVDLSYRYILAMQEVYRVIQSGELGTIYGVELIFHNAYGPDKPWFYDPALSGGGCVIDLGVHLVDLALWCLQFPEVETVTSSLFSKGQPLTATPNQVEDYATASIQLQTGTHLQLTCSWNLPAGQEAIISAVFYGTNGGVAFKNTSGSFYNFTAERYYGTRTETLFSSPDDWSGRAGVVWANRVAAGEKFNPEAEEYVKVAAALDKIYKR